MTWAQTRTTRLRNCAPLPGPIESSGAASVAHAGRRATRVTNWGGRITGLSARLLASMSRASLWINSLGSRSRYQSTWTRWTTPALPAPRSTAPRSPSSMSATAASRLYIYIYMYIYVYICICIYIYPHSRQEPGQGVRALALR